MKKLLLTLGTVAATAAPIVTIIACGDTKASFDVVVVPDKTTGVATATVTIKSETTLEVMAEKVLKELPAKGVVAVGDDHFTKYVVKVQNESGTIMIEGAEVPVADDTAPALSKAKMKELIVKGTATGTESVDADKIKAFRTLFMDYDIVYDTSNVDKSIVIAMNKETTKAEIVADIMHTLPPVGSTAAFVSYIVNLQNYDGSIAFTGDKVTVGDTHNTPEFTVANIDTILAKVPSGTGAGITEDVAALKALFK